MTDYLLKTILCSGVLLLFYKIILENETFHRFKRYYLLISQLICFIIPLIELEINNTSGIIANTLFARTNVVDLKDPQLSAPIQKPDSVMLSGLTLIYCLITTFLLIRLACNLVILYRTIKQNERTTANELNVILLKSEMMPHSFLNYVFVNKDDFKNRKIDEEILCHESVHIREKHSIDILFIELLQVFFWFNPFIIFFRQSIKINHEFLADAFVISQTGNVAAYQKILLSKVASSGMFLYSEINYSLTKKRFTMMTRKTHQWIAQCKKLSMLPLLAGVVVLFSTKIAAQQKDTQETLHSLQLSSRQVFCDALQGVILEADTILCHTDPEKMKINTLRALYVINGVKSDVSILEKKTIFAREIVFFTEGDPDGIRLYGNQASSGVIVLNDARFLDTPMRVYYKEALSGSKKGSDPHDIIFNKTEVAPEFAGGESAWQQYILNNLHRSVPLESKAPKGKYNVKLQFVVGLDGSIRDIKALTQVGYGMEDEAIRLLKSSPQWTPAMQNNRQVQAYKSVDIIFHVK
jgi:beta-lactamase regulating signal transducer with metallopeptidase domain